MVLEAGARRALGNRLEEVLGMPHADVLISALPPVGWDEVATRQDIARLDARFDAVDARFDRLERSIESLRNQLITMMSAALLAIATLVVALVELD